MLNRNPSIVGPIPYPASYKITQKLYTHICICVHVCICVYVYIHTRVYTYVRVCMKMLHPKHPVLQNIPFRVLFLISCDESSTPCPSLCPPTELKVEKQFLELRSLA